MRLMIIWLLVVVLSCVSAQLGSGDPDSVITNKRTRTNPGAAFVSILGKSPTKHPAQSADFGDSLVDGETYNANLMLPPEGYETLCEFPDVLMNVGRIRNSSSQTSNIFDPSGRREIALLVKRGQCSFDQKARVALEIRNNVSSSVQYMVVYNNDKENPQDLIIMSTNATGPAYRELQQMSFIFVSHRSGRSIMGRISEELEQDDTESPYYMADPNNTWYLPILIDAFPPNGDPSDNNQQPPFPSNNNDNSFGGASSSTARQTFHWLRFILFSLLIVSPCVRAGYLWYSAGGRILIHRNERGQAVGFLYVRPMPFWFSNAMDGGPGAASSGEQVSDCLTNEEFKGLPELVYRTPKEEKDRPEDSVTLDVSAHTDKVTLGGASEAQVPFCSKPGDLELVNLDDRVSKTTTRQILHTTCTMCSICIEDFEDGEKIRVLPRCKHAFHTECIQPWLIERHGCCPLCKTQVLGRRRRPDTHDTESERSDEVVNEAGQSTNQSLDNAGASGVGGLTPTNNTNDDSPV